MPAQQTTAAKPFKPSNELNKHLPKWLSFSAVYRARVEGFRNAGFREGNSDSYFLNRIRINMGIRPTNWLQFQFQGQDARAWGRKTRLPPLAEDAMDLRVGYVELGNTENLGFAIRGGRQELVMGDQRLVGHVSWLNVGRTFDAVRATMQHGGLKLDAFASSVVRVDPSGFNRSRTGDNLHGLYGVIDRLIPKAKIDPYLYWRVGPRRFSEAGEAGKFDFWTFGFRWYGNLPSQVDYTVQLVGQSGNISSDDYRTMASELLIGKTLSTAWTPRISVEYNYASGDTNPNDGKQETFDTLYPTLHDVYGLADQVGWKNVHHIRTGVEAKPYRRWRIKINYHSWWRASLRDGLYNAGGVRTVASTDPADGRHIGQEIDFQAFFSPTPTITIGGGVGHVFPGEFLKNATPGASYTFPYILFNWAL